MCKIASLLGTGASLALAVAPLGLAQAQSSEVGAQQSDQAEAIVVDTIVVTARRQTETTKDIPATVAVVTADALVARGIGSGLDINGLVPGLQMTNALAGAVSPTIRGLGSNTAVFSIESSVASFFDGVYAAHPRDMVSPIFDLERIEVIKGTQSTTLGKNTTLGALSFVSRRPGRDFGFDSIVTQEFELDSSRMEAGVDLPISDTLRVRASGLYDNERGFVENRLRDTVEPTRRRAAGRSVLVWEPSDEFNATLIYQHDTYDEDGQSVHLLQDSATGTIGAIAASLGQTEFEVRPGISYNGYPERRPFDEQDSDRATIIAEYDFNGFTLSSQTAYVDWREAHRNDLDFVDASLITFQVDEANELFSQEVRLSSPTDGRLSYAVGAYYLWNEWRHDQTVDAQSPWPRAGAVTHFYEQTVNSLSGFAQANASVTENIKLSGGLRYTSEDKDARFSRVTLTPGSIAAIFAPFAERRPTRSESNLDLSFSAQYYLDPSNVLYAAAARGSKSGGFQSLPSNPDLAEFEGEEAVTLEVGVKLRPLNTLSLEFALYSTTVDDFQYNINTAAGNSIANAKVRSRGFDTSFNFRPFEQLRFEGGVVYADAEILEAFPGAPAGTRVQRAPEWSGNVAAFFEHSLSDALELTINPSVDFASSQDNQLPSVGAPRREAYNLVNLRVAVGDVDGRWEVAFIGRNLTDERPYISATVPLLLTGPFFGNLQPPTTYALQLKVRY